MKEIQKILSSIGKHTLHLYTSGVNKYSIQAPFLAQAKPNEKITYITKREPAKIIDGFKEIINLDDIKLSIIKPSEIRKIKNSNKLRIVADNIDYNIVKKFKGTDNIILSIYNISKIKPEMIKKLVKIHDKLVLTRDGSSKPSTLVASETLDKLDDSAVEKFVKNELETITLALILNKPMCGTDIIKILHKKFNVLVSPGTLYPLLHNLEKNGLLRCEYRIKNKVYEVKNKTEIKNMLSKHLQVGKILSRFLEINIGV